MVENVSLFDTTLRDGQLSPDVHFTSEERIELACALERAGIDVIEVAFPAMHPEDIPSTRLLAREIRDASLCCLARLHAEDIESAADVLSPCPNPRLHVYLDGKSIRSVQGNSSGQHATTRMVENMVRYARNLTAEVEFSPQDATRVEIDSLCAVTQAALAGGAQIINLSDTAGTASPGDIKTLMRRIHALIADKGDAVISLHAHNHLGNAIDNALAAIAAGAGQIEGTVNGIGPAGGNTDLVRLVERLDMKAKSTEFAVKADTFRLQALSRRLAGVGQSKHRNKHS